MSEQERNLVVILGCLGAGSATLSALLFAWYRIKASLLRLHLTKTDFEAWENQVRRSTKWVASVEVILIFITIESCVLVTLLSFRDVLLEGLALIVGIVVSIGISLLISILGRRFILFFGEYQINTSKKF